MKSKIISLKLPQFIKGQMVDAIMTRGFPKFIKPVLHSAVVCPMCNQPQGFPIKDGGKTWWSCCASSCITANARRQSDVAITSKAARMRAYGVPMMYCTATDTRWKHPDSIRNDILVWLKGGHGFLVLSGPRGCGKSYIAAAILSGCTTSTTKNYIFVDQVQLKYDWTQSFKDDTTDALIARLTQSALVVIDDLGQVKPSDAFHEFLYLIVNKRYSDGRLTIITTNMDAKEIQGQLDGAISSRILGGCSRFIRMGGKDMRLTQ